MIDCTGAAPVEDAVVIVEEGKITAVGSVDQVNVPNGAEVIDVGDATILPGLIDVHEHLALCPELGYQRGQMMSPEVDLCFRMARNARTVLRSGITTIRSCGDKSSLDLVCKKAIQDGFIPGPRMIVSGAGIRASHGHGAVATTIADGVDALRSTVRKHIFSGVDHIKIFVSGGGGTIGTVPWQTYYTRDEIAAAVEEAHNMNKTITTHCHGGHGADWCIDAGIDSIEHGTWCTMEQLERMAEKGTWLVPTLAVSFQPDNPTAPPLHPELAAKKEEGKKLKRERFPKIINMGIKLAAGTDNLHGMIWNELQWMVNLGMDPMAALLTATRDAAQLCRMQESVGTLEPGKMADIIGVGGDPLADISCLKNVSFVMKEGVRYQLAE